MKARPGAPPLDPVKGQPLKSVTFTADDFGLCEAVNEAVERAHREGCLDAASLMVAGPAAGDAVRRARTMPNLRVGLHLVVVEGPAVLPYNDIPDLVDEAGWFRSDQARLGFRYFLLPHVRRQLAAEIAAQFDAFAATGLPLGHADAHKHMHLHPTVGRLMIAAGLGHGLTRIRVPIEPADVLAVCGTRVGFGAKALRIWSAVLRGQAHRAGLLTDDHVFGIAWSGHMTTERVGALLPALASGSSEIYFHPATKRDTLLDRLMPGVRPRGRARDSDGSPHTRLDPGQRRVGRKGFCVFRQLACWPMRRMTRVLHPRYLAFARVPSSPMNARTVVLMKLMSAGRNPADAATCPCIDGIVTWRPSGMAAAAWIPSATGL